MPEDRSLDEFAGANAGDPDGGGRDGDGVEDDGSGGIEDGNEIDGCDESGESAGTVASDPAIATSTWTEDGADCERCDETVARRWLDDGAFVCTDCKEW
ncbi:DUF7573 domain-containing protein [Halorubrum trueperi]|uniref:DUF7573 domain-containing protein n=1 Tax=Halorubrum trueperi TaxID=2004704 RepID=A0ABD5UNZ3_9EURY